MFRLVFNKHIKSVYKNIISEYYSQHNFTRLKVFLCAWNNRYCTTTGPKTKFRSRSQSHFNDGHFAESIIAYVWINGKFLMYVPSCYFYFFVSDSKFIIIIIIIFIIIIICIPIVLVIDRRFLKITCFSKYLDCSKLLMKVMMYILQIENTYMYNAFLNL